VREPGSAARALRDSVGIATAVRETEDILRRELDLEPRELPSDLARAEGTLRGNPIVIETTMYVGPQIRLARFATILGEGLAIGNALCLSRPEIPLPIFGADLVALSADATMIAVDLSPVLPQGAERDAQLALVAEARAAHPAFPDGGELPSFCASWFSPFALFTRVDALARSAALSAYSDFHRVFVAIARRARGDSPPSMSPAEVRAAQASYLADHRNDDKGLRMLARLFGVDWSSRYIVRVLFPDTLD
jgi:phycocyanobilin:ferredoxin oxidoreductase